VQHGDRNPISKALRALGWLIQTSANEVGVRELAGAMKISPSSAHRILMALSDEGFVKQNPRSSRYSLAVEFLRLAHIAISRAPIRQAAMEPMRQLVDACNETALFGVYDRTRQEMIFALSVESSHSLRYAIELNKWAPVYTGASGLAIMAFLDDAEIQSVIQRTRLEPLTDRSITEAYRIEAEIATIRRQGFAFTRGQRIPGAVGIAAPVFGGNGDVIGDVCLTIPEQRFDEAGKDRLVDLLLACAKRSSTDLTGAPRRHAAE
jgi:DNA-binding IclR family transcriptional regulator